MAASSLRSNSEADFSKKAPSVADIFANYAKVKLDLGNGATLFACKVVERKFLCKSKEHLVVNEIMNQDSI